jgi:hypothetical protein
MKTKIAIGCLVLLVVLVIGGGLGIYFFVVKPAKSYVESLTSLTEISDLERDIQDQSAYAAPEGGELTKPQVQRFVNVQRELLERLGNRTEQLSQKYEEYNQQLQDEDSSPGIGALLQMWNDLRGVFREAKETQVQALNRQEFSLEEYKWVKGQFYKALGADIVSLGLDQLAEAIQEQDPGILARREELESLVPEKNKELVAPYKEEAQKWIAFAWLGI